MIKIAFMGSAQFSIASFEELLNCKEIEIKAVLTTPAKPKGRGMKLQNNVVHDFALKNGFSEEQIFAIHSFKESDVSQRLVEMDLDFIVVVAFGKIIPEGVIRIPKIKILNLHPSVLPKYRGAAPIERAIENGEKEIEICIMEVVKALDAGDVYASVFYDVEGKYASEIVPEVARRGAVLMRDVLLGMNENFSSYKPRRQNEEDATYAHKIEKNELLLDFSQNVEVILNKVRAFDLYGGCYFVHNRVRVKVFEVQIRIEKHSKEIGFFDVERGEVYCNGGVVVLKQIQLENQKRCEFWSAIGFLK
ncbi:MAG: hypothetical protein RL208_292 [Pseudomonadota bacterium]|jgi:methionyl-tRNA formyltransferase